MGNITVTDVRAHPGDSAFLIDDGTTAILVDSGYGFTAHLVAARIARQLGSRPLDYIFLTHSHYDHALGSAAIAKHWPDVKIIAGAYAARIFQKDSAKRTMRELDQKAAASCGIFQYEDCADDLRVDQTVEDGDLIVAGDLHFTVVNLPGHTRCSVGFYLSEEKFLISTETLGVRIGRSTVFPSYLVGYGMTMDSIARAEALDIERMLLPHCGIIEGDDVRQYLSAAKASAAETAEVVSAMLRAGKSKQDAVQYIIETFYHDDIRRSYPPAAMQLNTNIMVDLIERELVLPGQS